MDRQNTNEKKTLKKGRRGWVISAAIVALLGILAGTVVLQNQSSQNQGQCESVTVSDQRVSVTSDSNTLSKIDKLVAVLPTSEKITGNYSGSVPLQAVDKNGTVLPTIITPFETTLKVVTKPARNTSSTTTSTTSSETTSSTATVFETKPNTSNND